MQINAICPELIYENNIEMFDKLYQNILNENARCQFLSSFIQAEMNSADAKKALTGNSLKTESLVSTFVADSLSLFVQSKVSAFDFFSKEKTQKINSFKSFINALKNNNESLYINQIRKSIEKKAR